MAFILSKLIQKVGALVPRDIVDYRRLHSEWDLGGFSVHSLEYGNNRPVAWQRAGLKGGIELWLNVSGQFTIKSETFSEMIEPSTHFFLHSNKNELDIHLPSNEEVKIIMIHLDLNFLKTCIPTHHKTPPPWMKELEANSLTPRILSRSSPLTSVTRNIALSLSIPPIPAAAHPLWYQAKVLEILASTLFETSDPPLFCTRQKQLSRERIDRVKTILHDQLVAPPNLREIAREVGCSPYYLSRMFSRETGMTIPQYLREIRIERAAELLRSGQCNVTEAAFEVGYNSSSHFSQAFCNKMGVCPALYGLKA